ncbi:Hsp70 family protein [bacterium]|nr:Hsp70 family protein [bacterium]
MSNIEIGIDLGTTNSEVAILNNGQIEIVKNTYGDEFTPSVFGINKAKDEEVGKKPYQRYFKDATPDEIKNNKPEVKRLMGTSDSVYFPRIDKSYNAEEISARILNSLKQEALRKNDKLNTSATVITIPAHFSTIQAEATKRAGILAGFKYVVLLQEPIAAAISYGFGKNINENWLVYDLGGGTFDAALISSKDGNLKVLSHNGDNFLGGKDIDTKIVDEIIVPELCKKYELTTFNRANSKYSVEFAKLKYAAEQAKIQLSSLNEVNIEVDINIDDKEIYENILITRDDLHNILYELIKRTISLCEQTISDAGIKTESVNKIILVGGPTQLPFIKSELESSMGILVDTSSDPLTAVARGACIFATSQAIPTEFNELKVINDSTYDIKLNYDSLTCEEDELITGIIPNLKDVTEDYFIQIQSQDNTFNTGKIKLKDGKFVTNVVVKPNCLNSYWLYLFDNDGNTLEVATDEFSITHGLTVAGAPIPHSIGVGVSIKDWGSYNFKQGYEVFFDKNSILPLEKTVSYKTTKTVKAGETQNCLPITVYEGENKIPEHNIFICEIALTGEDLDTDLYEGSQVDITIKVDESRTVSLEAYIPVIDKAFNARATIFDEDISVEKLQENINNEIDKIQKIESYCTYDEKEKIYNEVQDIKAALINAKNDEDEKRKTNIRIKKLQAEIDKLEETKNDDSLKSEFYNLVESVEDAINGIKEDDRKIEFQKRFIAVKGDGEKAIENNNMLLLSKINEQLDSIMSAIVISDDYTWLYWLNNLSKNPDVMQHPEAQKIIEDATIAFKSGNMNKVKECVRTLWSYLPDDEQNEIQAKIAGITH